MIETCCEPMSTAISGPRISVAMATYNGERYIREQLDSIARQDLRPLEIVVTDDGSTDATLQIVDDFARSTPFPVRIFRNETRLGYADNFLKAASLCHGNQIAFCDQDDIWIENKLRVCSGFFGNPEVLLVAHSGWTLLESGTRGHRFPNFSRTKMPSRALNDPLAFVNGFAMVIRRDLLNLAQLSIPVPRPARLLGHDQLLWFLAASLGAIATTPHALTLYRQHQSNVFGLHIPTVARRAQWVVQTLDYNALADFEMICSRILLNAAEQLPDRADRLSKSAGMFDLRAKLHRMRNRIYSRESTFWQKAATFVHICSLGGYLPDQSRTRLGPRAGMKDALFGVPGIYQLFVPAARPSKEA